MSTTSFSLIFCLLTTLCCCQREKAPRNSAAMPDTAIVKPKANTPARSPAGGEINTGDTSPAELVHFALSLRGTPYKYGCTDPQQGFDCSGFITYVFNHFGIEVPRSSAGFEHEGQEVPVGQSKPGDLILFTGTDSTKREIGHMGIILRNDNRQIEFIHSTSGKAYAVTVTPLNSYYQGRFVKVIRVFNKNGQAGG